MEIAALAAAVLALLIALAARSKVAGMTRRVEEAEDDARRRTENAAEELRREVETTRRLLARLVEGDPLTAEMVLEGQLWRDVSPADGKRMVDDDDPRVIDVRTPREVAQGILPGATLLPIEELEERWREIPKDGRATLIYCASGGRSAAACEFLSLQGYTNLHNLDGGIMAWPGTVERPTS